MASQTGLYNKSSLLLAFSLSIIAQSALLELVGLAGFGKKRPHELSGGEQQRVGIARALANNAELLLADEPTGQLDSQTARQIMSLIRSIVHGEGITAIAATHDRALMDLADRVLIMENGQLKAA